MSSALLKVEGLTLVTQHGSIVNNLSFQVDSGEILALTGKSGSGKTSIAMAILDLLPPGIRRESGTIHWTGKDNQQYQLPTDSKSWRSLRGTHIGFTQQDVFGAFDPVLRMGEQMIEIIRERTITTQPDPVKELRMKMEEVGLHDLDRLWKSYPHQLSGGQLQRCQIAMAIVIQPALLITDEPTSAIDKINQLELLDVFAMLRYKYNTSILCITHEEAVIRHLADREIRLDAITSDFTLPDAWSKKQVSIAEKNILEVKGLTYAHAYGGLIHKEGAIIGELDFKVQRGRCLGIVGESGSGKSTLAQLLVGLYKPLQGSVVLDGTEIDFKNARDLRALRTRVQLVMQDGRGSLHPHFTIRTLLEQVIAVGKKEQPGFTIDMAEHLRQVGLEESVLIRKASLLSGGECLRVSIARALIMQPEVLICDESTSALDGPTRDGIMDLLLHLMKQQNLALIFISHDEKIIRGVSDDILVLANGKIVESGPAADVISHPTHPVTQKIFGAHATLVSRRRL